MCMFTACVFHPCNGHGQITGPVFIVKDHKMTTVSGMLLHISGTATGKAGKAIQGIIFFYPGFV